MKVKDYIKVGFGITLGYEIGKMAACVISNAIVTIAKTDKA